MLRITFQLYDQAGQRNYLTAEERTAFLKAAEHVDRQARTFFMTLILYRLPDQRGAGAHR